MTTIVVRASLNSSAFTIGVGVVGAFTTVSLTAECFE